MPEPLDEAIRACRPHLAAAALFSFFINLLFLAPAIYMLQVYDRVVATGGKMTLLFVTLALVIALLALAAFDAIRTRLLVRASVRLDTLVTPVILRRMLAVGGSQSLQAQRDFDTVRQAVASPVAAALLDAPWAPIFIIVAFLLHFWVGVLAVVSVGILLALAWRNQQATREAVEIATRSMADANASGQAIALHGETVRSLGMTGAMTARQFTQRRFGLGRLANSQLAGARFSALSRFLRLFVQSGALAVGALLAIAGEISAGGIIAASILLGRALQPVESLVGSWSTLSGARASLERLAEALNRTAEPPRVRTLLPRPEGRLDVEQLGLRGSDGRPVLLGISFSARPGEILGIVGPSGSGKTTLAKLIVGAANPEVGAVRIDGAQRSDWDADLLGRYIGYLPQEPSLFEGTVKDNISRFAGWGDQAPEDIDAQVIAAAKLAGVHELILQLAQGYDSWLGPLGAGLSSGQAQRIALARAFYGQPSLIVLDEPNAFLDADGEAALIAALDEERRRGACILVIAHRRAVIASADRLLVLEGGRPKMIGPANEVVARLAGRPEGESAA